MKVISINLSKARVCLSINTHLVIKSLRVLDKYTFKGLDSSRIIRVLTEEMNDMSVKCGICGKTLENSRALGSHMHYMHENQNPVQIYASQDRTDDDKKRFQRLFKSCIADRNLSMPSSMDKVEQTMSEIPKGISPTLDRYRDAFKCALNKEKILNEFESMILEEEAE